MSGLSVVTKPQCPNVHCRLLFFQKRANLKLLKELIADSEEGVAIRKRRCFRSARPGMEASHSRGNSTAISVELGTTHQSSDDEFTSLLEAELELQDREDDPTVSAALR